MEKTPKNPSSAFFLEDKAYGVLPLYHEILASRSDGFFKFQSVLHRLSIHDTVSVRLVDSPSYVKVTSSDPLFNTEYLRTAVRGFITKFDLDFGADIRVASAIPPNCGLFESESNCATALKLINRLSGDKVSQLDLLEFANGISNELLCCAVRGHKYVDMLDKNKCMITSLPPLKDFGVLILLPDDSQLPTFDEAIAASAEFYGNFYEQHKHHPRPSKIIESIHGDDGIKAIGDIFNVFEAPTVAKYPQTAKAISILNHLGALNSCTVGHGNAAFGIFPDEASTAKAERSVIGFRTLRTRLF